MIKSKKLTKIKNIKHGFFNSIGGHSKKIYKSLNCGPGSLDNKINVKKNLQIVRKKISNKAKNIFLLHQIHSNKFIFIDKKYNAPNLIKLLSSDKTFIFHYARHDLAAIKHDLDVMIKNVYCTKIASKIARTYTQAHGYKDLVRELLNVDISKKQQSSDWSNPINAFESLPISIIRPASPVGVPVLPVATSKS